MTLHLTQENFEKEVVQSKVPVIIDFYADWCGPCRMMAPVFEEISKEYSGKVSFLKLNTEEQPEIAEAFEVMSIPSLVVVRDGKEIGRMVGFAPKNIFKERLDSIIK